MGILGTLKRAFSKLLRWFWSYLRDIISEHKEEILAKLLEIAIQVVKDLVKAPLSGGEKRIEAYKRILQLAKRKGLVPKEHEIFAVIELAVLGEKVEEERAIA